MKRFAFAGAALAIGVFAACSGGNNNSSAQNATNGDSGAAPVTSSEPTTGDAAVTTTTCPASTTVIVDAGATYCQLTDGAVEPQATAISNVCPYLPSDPTLSSTFVASSGECELPDGAVVTPPVAQQLAASAPPSATTPGNCTVNQTAGQNGATPLVISSSGTICGSTSAADPNGDLYEAIVQPTQSVITITVAPTGDALFVLYDNRGIQEVLGNVAALTSAVALGGNVFTPFTIEVPAGDSVSSGLTWSSASLGARYSGVLGIQVISPSRAVGQTYQITVAMQ